MSRFDLDPLVAHFNRTRAAALEAIYDEWIAYATRLDAAGELDDAATERIYVGFTDDMDALVQESADEILQPALAAALTDRDLISEAVDRGVREGASCAEVAGRLVDATIHAALATHKAQA